MTVPLSFLEMYVCVCVHTYIHTYISKQHKWLSLYLFFAFGLVFRSVRSGAMRFYVRSQRPNSPPNSSSWIVCEGRRTAPLKFFRTPATLWRPLRSSLFRKWVFINHFVWLMGDFLAVRILYKHLRLFRVYGCTSYILIFNHYWFYNLQVFYYMSCTE